MKNENEERDELQEMVQQLSKEKQQSSKDESLDLKYNAIMSSGQLDREETTQKANLSSESYGCHSEVDSNGNDVEDLAALNEMQLLNSEDSREILQFFQISTSQYTVASSTYLKVNSSSRFEHCQHSRAMVLIGIRKFRVQFLTISFNDFSLD